jgi:RNA polymerase sigma-70 factor (ECF subfamily)
MAVDRALCRHSEQENAFLELINRVEGELGGVVRHLVRSRHATQDIVQKTFLLAWRDAKFDPTHVYARAWLFRTARRLVSDWLASAESNSVSLDDLSERDRRDGSRGSRSAMPVDRTDGDPLTKLIDEERNRSLALAMSWLEEDEREVIERYYLRQEGTQFEIAEAMGLSVAAFNSRLNRARKQLKREILIISEHDGQMGPRHGFL